MCSFTYIYIKKEVREITVASATEMTYSPLKHARQLQNIDNGETGDASAQLLAHAHGHKRCDNHHRKAHQVLVINKERGEGIKEKEKVSKTKKHSYKENIKEKKLTKRTPSQREMVRNIM